MGIQSKRELLAALRPGYRHADKARVMQVSSANLDRKLQPARRRRQGRGPTTTRAGSLLKISNVVGLQRR